MKALGLIEVQSVTAAIDALDIMCKTADVSFVTWERKLGGRLVTVVVAGGVSAVNEAVAAALRGALIKPCAHTVLANPHEETLRILAMSASKWEGGQAHGAAIPEHANAREAHGGEA